MLISKKLKTLHRAYLVLLVCFFYKLIFIANAVELKGNFIQGGIIFGKTTIGNTVFYNNLKVPIDENGEFIIGLGRTHPKFGNLKIIKSENDTITKNIEIKQRK